MSDLELTFIHPTDSTRTFPADVSPEKTADECIEELASHGFFTRQDGHTYRLADSSTHKELRGNETLAQSGVASGSALNIIPSTQGARRD